MPKILGNVMVIMLNGFIINSDSLIDIQYYCGISALGLDASFKIIIFTYIEMSAHLCFALNLCIRAPRMSCSEKQVS